MSLFSLKPAHKPVQHYYATLKTFHDLGHDTEGNTRAAFADLLKRCASSYDWHLVEEYPFKGTSKQPLRADGALVDSLTLVHGLWEAKDTTDDLQREIKSKVAKGYPLTNILFQSPDRAVLYQDNRIALDCDLRDPEKLIEILQLFFDHRQPHEVDWEEAVVKFSEKIPDLANGVTKILEKEHQKNEDFRQKFADFAELCRQSINPELTDDAIRKMLVQHLLTERIFRNVFDNKEFLNRNVIAVEIEKVIKSITDKHFSRDTFLKSLDRFYKAIEEAARSQTGYTEKQHFLNAVYEKFFQSFDRKQADTHGIVYTPQPIVDFMVRSVEEILQQEFGRSLSDSGVHILDPFTGTGNFITRIMQGIRRSALPQKYAEELHCNEIMLLPYYIASMNIEHAYMERVGEYSPFEGICLVDTFDLAEAKQRSLFTTENTARVLRQKKAPIRVVLGNPPYNSGQANENDNNKNRKYPVIDQRVKALYAAGSKASLLTSLSDPYVKAFRWASDRIEKEGIVAFVSNSSFVDQVAFDQMRKQLSSEFDHIYVYDLGGNVRKNPKLSGTTHNVFGIQVGVSITFLVRTRQFGSRTATISYFASELTARRGEKYKELDQARSIAEVKWSRLKPDNRNNWLTAEMQQDYADMLSLGQKDREEREGGQTIFNLFSHGINTQRDTTLYGFDAEALELRIAEFSEAYNAEVSRWIRSGRTSNVDGFVDYGRLKWSRNLKRQLTGGTTEEYNPLKVCRSLYRPFTTSKFYRSEVFVDESGRMQNIFSEFIYCEHLHLCHVGRLREAISKPGSFTYSQLPPSRSRVWNTMLSLLHLRRRRFQPPRKHHRLGAR